PLQGPAPTLCKDLHPEIDPENKIQGNYTPPTPSLRSDPPPRGGQRVGGKVQVSLELFPREPEGQEALRAQVLTPELDAWALDQQLHLDLVKEFQHWLQHGIAKG